MLSSLVFSEFLSLRSFEGPFTSRPILAECSSTAQGAHRITAKHLAQPSVIHALRNQTPQVIERAFQPGDEILT